MNFADRITRHPLAFDPDRGAEMAALFPEFDGRMADLIAGVGGTSPYLSTLLGKEREWLIPALEAPEAALDQEYDRLREVAGVERGGEGRGTLAVELRRAKRRVALMTALADLGGVWPLEQVTGALTDFAGLAVDLAMGVALAPDVRRGKLPGMTEADLETCCGWVALAMGKLGAGELNYSSDIDLICLFDETRFERDDFLEARTVFVKATRRMAAMLSDLTGDGYVFRTDLRLRPDPSVTPVCVSMEAAERYYESLGRTWERAAYIKARPCAGDIKAGERFLKALRPFVWRKHLDFAAIQDAHDMRLRIREHKGTGGTISLPGHDMKLGRGGIREIEFFTQTRQLIAGGRDEELRVRGTVEGLRVLARKGWLPEEAAETLITHYRYHRDVEHRIQMVNDTQTHRMPGTGEGITRIAALMGQQAAGFGVDLRARLRQVHDLTESFFAPDGSDGGSDGGGEGGEAHSGFDPEIIGRWPGYAALRSERALGIFRRLRPEILRRLRDTSHPDEALIAFDGFLAGLPAGVQLFSLFEANPQLVDLLVDIVGTAPELARHLSGNAQVFDAVIGGDFFAPWPGQEALLGELSRRLGEEADYERKLDLVRRWYKEWHFRIGVHHLRHLIDAEAAGAQYADLARVVLAAVWPEVVAHFAVKHGTPPGRGACVIGMGSLGAGMLNAASDLDLIVIYDPEGAEMSEGGRRPLATRPYYARLTQAMITALTAPMAEGRLFEVDMRLRPSGNQGPVATSLASFTAYQRDEAWVWEHLALTRARVMAGAEVLGQDIEAFRAEVLAQKGQDRGRILRELSEMRDRIAAAKSPGGPWEAKLGPGRLQDIQLMSQAGALMAGEVARDVDSGLRAGIRAGWLQTDEVAVLMAAHDLCWKLQAVTRLLGEKALTPEGIGAGARALCQRELGLESLDNLSGIVAERCDAAADVIQSALGRG